jgi:signal transduction histidine kinase
MVNLDWRFLPVIDARDPATAYHGIYDPWLVATSLAIAVLAALVALSISARIIAAASPRARWAWTTAGAISMGGGIWSMHFIGMLAFSLPCGVSYQPIGTVLSMLPGMLASGIALGAISRSGEAGLGRLTASAVLMGAGIGAMHYSGMAAMMPAALLRYDPGIALLSIVVAVALAFVSLGVRFSFRRIPMPRASATIIAATIMGCAVAGMHYTAMQAAIFFPLPDAPAHSMALSPTLLALLIAIFTVLIAASTLLATFAGRQNELALTLKAEVARRRGIEADLVRAREQAEAANQAKSQFLATMSHELRTPLNAVIGYSELLLDEAEGRDDEQVADLRRIHGAGRHLLSLVTDVLDLSKIEAGKMELVSRTFDLDKLIDDVAATCRSLVLHNGNELVVERAAGLGIVHADPTKLRQIVMNLLGNAAKFTKEGRVTLEAARRRDESGDWISIAVRDTGIGIPREALAKLFRNFQQAEATTASRYGGTGLGLALSQRLCLLMGGEITVESEPGHGSCFTVRLPAAPAQAAA